jgi:predicted peroxiredoxin
MSEKYAIVTLTDPLDHARIYHAFLYLVDLRDNGIEAELFLDGAQLR